MSELLKTEKSKTVKKQRAFIAGDQINMGSEWI